MERKSQAFLSHPWYFQNLKFSSAIYPSKQRRSRTFVPWSRKLQNIDELGVESRGHLHAHAAGKKTEVHSPKVGLFIPSNRILGRNLGDNRVRNPRCTGNRIWNCDTWCHVEDILSCKCSLSSTIFVKYPSPEPRCLQGRGSKGSDPGLWTQYIFNIRTVSHIIVGLKIASRSLVAFSLIQAKLGCFFGTAPDCGVSASNSILEKKWLRSARNLQSIASEPESRNH